MKEIAKNTVELRFDTSATDFSFRPGQYLSIVQPDLEDISVKEAYREFSIVSSPGDPYLTVAFRRSSSVFKQHLLEKKVGDVVTIEGPFGVFYPPDTAKNIVYIAGGIGITAFLNSLRAPTPGNYIELYTFNTKEETAPYLDELHALAKISGFKHNNCFERVSLENITIANVPDLAVLIAGPNGFVKAARATVMSLGINKNIIQTEEFTGYA
jgi:ferredoxin-NADP reductase